MITEFFKNLNRNINFTSQNISYRLSVPYAANNATLTYIIQWFNCISTVRSWCSYTGSVLEICSHINRHLLLPKPPKFWLCPRFPSTIMILYPLLQTML